MSQAELLASLPEADRAKALDGLSETQFDALAWDWRFWGRPEQIAPEGGWLTWIINAGRGFGKTRAGAEWVRSIVCGSTPLARGAYGRIALIAETAADARDVMVEGDSGILSVHPPGFRPLYEPSKRRVTWPNGAVATLFNATEPDQLRGPQFDAAWCDELAKWAYARETWDMLQFGLRLGINPKQLVTTTPRPIPVLREIMAAASTVVTRGATRDNSANLAPAFVKSITDRYAGTRLGRQELEAEILDDVPGALWTRAMMDACRVQAVPDLQRVVVAVDPSGTKGAEDGGDSIGIVVAGKGVDGIAYVLADRTCKLSPDGWGRQAITAYREFKADRIVAERNFGGAMVEHVIRTVDRSVSYREVTASRGKVARAEPVAALYEQGRVKHSRAFTAMEDQMCLAAGTLVETDRGMVPIEQINTHDRVLTRKGFAPVKWVGYTGNASEFIEIGAGTCLIRATKSHPIFDMDSGEFVSAERVHLSQRLLVLRRWEGMVAQSRGMGVGIIGCHQAITGTQGESYYTERSMRSTRVQSLTGWMSTMWTGTQATTFLTTLRRCLEATTRLLMRQKASPFSAMSLSAVGARFAANVPKRTDLSQADTALTDATCRNTGQISRLPRSSHTSVSDAGGQERHQENDGSVRASARTITTLRRTSGASEPVYNLSVADGFLPEFFANGILVHNCSFTADGFLGDGSPDRVDAAVWALTELMLGDSLDPTQWIKAFAG